MSHGAAHEVPEVPTRMAAVSETAAPARSRVFLMCPSRGRAVMGSPLRSMSGDVSVHNTSRRGALAEPARFHSWTDSGSGPPVRLHRRAAARALGLQPGRMLDDASDW